MQQRRSSSSLLLQRREAVVGECRHAGGEEGTQASGTPAACECRGVCGGAAGMCCLYDGMHVSYGLCGCCTSIA